MTNPRPYETDSPGSFIFFEDRAQVPGFPYIALKQLCWLPGLPGGDECLKFSFATHTVKVRGTQLRKLLPLIHRQELFLVRSGATSEDLKNSRALQEEPLVVNTIQVEENEEEERQHATNPSEFQQRGSKEIL